MYHSPPKYNSLEVRVIDSDLTCDMNQISVITVKISVLMLSFFFSLSLLFSQMRPQHLNLSLAIFPLAVCECSCSRDRLSSYAESQHMWVTLFLISSVSRVLSSKIGFQQGKAHKIKLALSSSFFFTFSLLTSGNTLNTYFIFKSFTTLIFPTTYLSIFFF